MEELLGFCGGDHDSSIDITLSEDWVEFNNAKQLLLENEYQPDPEDPNTFTKVSSQIPTMSQIQESLPVHFPETENRPEHLLASSIRNLTSYSTDNSAQYSWRSGSRIQFDTSKLTPELQIFVNAKIPLSPVPLEKKQSVVLLVAIHPQVRAEQANLLVHLQPQLLQIGVPKAEQFPPNLSLGFFPCFTSLTLYPLFLDPSTVALPIYTSPQGSNRDDESDNTTAPRARTTTGTKLGAQVSGWGVVGFTAERNWQVETEEEARLYEKLVSVATDDGNAAGFEWSLLRWSEGKKYNAKKPHSRIQKLPNPPFSGGHSNILRLQRYKFPGALWHLHPQIANLGPLKFGVHIKAEMHLVWFKEGKFFKTAGSDSATFEWRNEFQVDMI